MAALETLHQLPPHKEQTVELVQLLRPQQGVVAVVEPLLLVQLVTQVVTVVLELRIALLVLL